MPTLILVIILFISAFIRLLNLDYNSPQLDEASYQMVGQFGLFENNWSEFNPGTWIGGAFWFYPFISAIGSIYQGVIGSRALNVLIGIASLAFIYFLVKQLKLFEDKAVNKVAALFVTFLVSISPSHIILSRLATYDMSSFALFILGLTFLLCANKLNSPIYYLSSVIAFLLSFFAKYFVLILLPLVIIFVLYKKYQDKSQLILFLKSFIFPIIAGLAVYFLLNGNDLIQFYQEQVSESASFSKIFSHFKDGIEIYYLLTSLALITLFILKVRLKNYLLLFIFPFLILITHILTKRVDAIEKHTIFAVVSLSIIISASLVKIIRWKVPVGITALSLGVALIAFYSYQDVNNFQKSWPNSNSLISFLDKNVTSHEKVYVQEGATRLTMLNKLEHDNVFFDSSFEYMGLSGQEALSKAVEDSYFDTIQLTDEPNSQYNFREFNQITTTHYSIVLN